MAALRKKIAEKKATLDQHGRDGSLESSHGLSSHAASKPVESNSAIKRGWLTHGSLYPEGSAEAAPKLWRGSESAANAKIFEFLTHDFEYEIRGNFTEAKHYLGKEDFSVTRNGLQLRIKGNPNDDPQSLVAGLDETISLPVDAAFDGMCAEYTKDFFLSIRIPRSVEMKQLLSQLTADERTALHSKLAQDAEGNSKLAQDAEGNSQLGVEP